MDAGQDALAEGEERREEKKRESDERAKKADRNLKQEIDKLAPDAQQAVSTGRSRARVSTGIRARPPPRRTDAL